jgi:anti-sigma factor RsiW
MAGCGYRLSAYLDKELPEQELRRIAGHLETCAACRDELSELRRISTQITQILGEKNSNSAPENSNKTLSFEKLCEIHKAVDRAAEMARFRNLERIAGALAGLAACLAVVGVLLTKQVPESAGGTVERAAATLPADEDLAAGKDTTSRDASVTAWMVADLSGGRERGNP